jgi:hypothetical protein
MALAIALAALPAAASGDIPAAPASPAPASPKLTAAWSNYLHTLDLMRQELEATPRYQGSPADRAKAFHTLMELQAMTYNFTVQPRMAQPRLFRNTTWATNIYTLGQNGPDTDYRMAFLDGTQTYRLTGHVGDTVLTMIQVFNGVIGEPGFKTLGTYNVKDFDVAADGGFDIVLGGPHRERNWIPLDPKVRYGMIQIRRMITDWNRNMGDMTIARIGTAPAGQYEEDEFSEAAMVTRLERATAMARYFNEDFTIQLYDKYIKANGGRLNTFILQPGTTLSQVGNPASSYAAAVFKLASDEALVISMSKPPQGIYWSFHTGDVWSRSLDFFERQSSLNKDQVALGGDGSLTLVVAASDPGIANWLDTAGRRDGVLIMRNYYAPENPDISSRVVKLTELRKALPQDTRWVNPQERAALLSRRRASYLTYYGE